MAGSRIAEFCRGFSTFLITPFAITDSLNNELQKDDDGTFQRVKREESHYIVGRTRGQTQSQYLNFGKSEHPGRAEAEALPGVSRAVVSK